MKMPNVSEPAKDSATIARANLGLLGRIRLKLAVVPLLVGMLLMPPEIRDATDEMTMKAEDEEE